ncbi:resolvase [Plantactinospora sp. BC1]|uniref:helix-turn-helix domain-containing protein n=1 Tax=Plantactinospora sp. BC1 TaxID=2108470 RepID=UPI000D16163E|nr:helix-turn-helix domain-containing protein [Plantactinospora sp. BC1]AVT30145.1 resolvase [Plantactinospora sp. BC1]
MIDPLAAEARRLRTVELLSAGEIRQRLGIGKDRLTALLRDVPAPEWTKRPNAKDELRARAVELRGAGRSVPEIAVELGVAKSTAYRWVQHLPLDPDPTAEARRRAHAQRMSEARWARHRTARDAAEADAHERAADEVGAVNARDLLIVGATLYWCEGTKSKPWRRDDRVTLVNSDVRLLDIFLRFLEGCGIDRSVPHYRLSIHESADAEAAARWWQAALCLPADRFRRPTLKRHRPKTTRYNTGAGYHGCLVVDVPGSRELYWRIEGVVAALGGGPKGVGSAEGEALG